MSSAKKRLHIIHLLNTEMRHFMVRFTLFNQQVADRVGLNATDLQCLHIVKLLGGATPGQIAQQTNLTTGGVTVMLDRLEKFGYIKREPNLSDRRSFIVQVQEKKLKKLYAIYKSKQAIMDRILSHKTDKELKIITHFFSEMRSEDMHDKKEM